MSMKIDYAVLNKKMSLSSLLCSPLPSICSSSVGFVIGCCYNKSLLQICYYYSAATIGITIIFTAVISIIGLYETKKDPSVGIVSILLACVPIMLCIYHNMVYWGITGCFGVTLRIVKLLFYIIKYM